MAYQPEFLKQAYRMMMAIRTFEERCALEFERGNIPGFVHVYAGQEAVATGVGMNLTDSDVIGSTHHDHGHCIAKGCDRRRRPLCHRRRGRTALAGPQGEPRRRDMRGADSRRRKHARNRPIEDPVLHVLPTAGRKRRPDGIAARAVRRSIKVGRFDLSANGKALAIADDQGFVKTIFDAASGELLGAHMIGPEVTEQIQGFSVAAAMESIEAELMRTIFAHPTPSETMHESVLDAFDRALHH